MIAIPYFVAIIIGFASSAHAFHCHVCTSLLSSDCDDPFEAKDKYDTNCKLLHPLETFTGCLKLKVTLNVGGSRAQIQRLCYWGDILNTEAGCRSDPSLPFIKQLSCDVCTGDLCNSSTATGPIAGAIALFFVLARMMS